MAGKVKAASVALAFQNPLGELDVCCLPYLVLMKSSNVRFPDGWRTETADDGNPA